MNDVTKNVMDMVMPSAEVSELLGEAETHLVTEGEGCDSLVVVQGLALMTQRTEVSSLDGESITEGRLRRTFFAPPEGFPQSSPIDDGHVAALRGLTERIAFPLLSLSLSARRASPVMRVNAYCPAGPEAAGFLADNFVRTEKGGYLAGNYLIDLATGHEVMISLRDMPEQADFAPSLPLPGPSPLMMRV